ncbi:ligand-binding sensor domain-containing diguanylate cyclase [Pseudomarimonas arenosa]|uniref:diguanylate cyclase n=1 Tax=Pseudomarimonas arenosa TaxID=2774145 RepID=A0AAW3ZH09_9GAMM|nr:ligand-binding sensor domain-containing diguanylate cyclase [Pseudomarimonas arenosa]MBD8525313.1 diguanylate cyclase [Pseudomarimonas arenosa]
MDLPRTVTAHAGLRLLLLLALAFSPALKALDPDKSFHDYVSDSWSIEQGLPQISALALAQDHQGYLWVGTQAGLARFDGHRFTVYTPENVPDLPGAYINALMVDRQRRLWIATYKGLAVWEQGVFSDLPLVQNGELQSPSFVALAQVDSDVLAAAGQTIFQIRERALEPLLKLPRSVHSLLAGPDALWIGSVGGVYRRAKSDAELQFLAFPVEANNAKVSSLVNSDERLWAGTSEGLFLLEFGQWQRYSDDALSQVPIEALLEDTDGNLWVAEIAHLSRIRGGRLVERIVREGTALAPRSLFQDREANLWLGSQWNGVTRLRNGWTRRFSRREGLATPLLWSVAAGEGDRLWVGTDEGLSLFEDGKFRHIVDGSHLPHPNAYTLLVEPGVVWIGTRRGLAVWQDEQLLQPERYRPMEALQINGIIRDRNGVLWFATTGGLFRDDGKKLQQFATADGLPDPRLRFLLQTRDGRLLLGGQAGLFEFSDGRVQPFKPSDGLPAGLDITALHELPSGDLVAGSLSEEVYFLHDQRWTRAGREQGMPSNAAFFIAHDDTYLWLGGIRGVERVPLSDLYALARGETDRVHGQMLLNERGDHRGGQKGFCCNGAGNAKGLQRGPELWAPTRDGLVVIDTDDVLFPKSPPTTVVERLRVVDEWRQIRPESTLELAASSRDLGFEFTAISFHEPRSVSFRYRLLGYHEDWRSPDEIGQRIVSYTNLPAGDLRFEVQGSTANGEWSDAASLDFKIAPSFGETTGFKVLVVASLVLLSWLAYRIQRLRYQRQAKQLEALVQSRTADLAEANQRLHEASQTDPLTGLRNRRYLAAQLPKDLAFYGRELRRGIDLGRVLIFAVVDIDHFKRINDTHGHAAGDRVLQQFATVLLGQVRTGDYVARWGGEEFVLVFRPSQSEYLPLLGDRVRAAVAAFPFDIGQDKPLSVTCSIGLVEYPLFFDGQQSLGWEQLIELADRALYRVKHEGRNGWGAYRPAREVNIPRVLSLLKGDEQGLDSSGDLKFIGGGSQAKQRVEQTDWTHR